MFCNECLHSKDNKCMEKACVYIHISDRELIKKGYHLGNNIWSFNNKNYKIIGFEQATNSFICIEAKI